MTMVWRSSSASVVALTLLLGACATAPGLTMPAGPVPDLRGAWKGTWGGTPLILVVLEQHEGAPADGVYFGPWHLGRELPGASGILTFTVRREPISVNVKGLIGDSNGRLTLVLEPVTANGGRITLRRVDEHRLIGVGTTPVSWEPQGPVELVRETPPASPSARP